MSNTSNKQVCNDELSSAMSGVGTLYASIAVVMALVIWNNLKIAGDYSKGTAPKEVKMRKLKQIILILGAMGMLGAGMASGPLLSLSAYIHLAVYIVLITQQFTDKANRKPTSFFQENMPYVLYIGTVMSTLIALSSAYMSVVAFQGARFFNCNK